MTESFQYELVPGTDEVFKGYLTKRMEMSYFSSARTVRNAVDHARVRASIRLLNKSVEKSSDGMVSKKDLQIILPEDVVSAEELYAKGDRAIV